jgi:hypothetical protein
MKACCCYAFILILLASCDYKKQLEKTLKTVRESTDTLAKSVPGERYLRLIDAVNSSDPKERKQARDFVRNAFNIDVDTDYEITATFTYDEAAANNGLHVDLFSAATPSQTDVTQFMQYSLKCDPAVASILPIPMTEAEIYTKIWRLIERNVQSSSKFVQPTGYSPAYYLIGVPPGGPHNEWDGYRKRLISDFTNAILSVRGNRTLPVNAPRRFRPFKPLEGFDYVFVVINKAEFEQVTGGGHGDNFKANVQTHKKDHPEQWLFDSRSLEFHKEDFTKNPPVKHSTRGEFVWAVGQITTYGSITKQTLTKIKEMREATTAAERNQGH